MQSLTSRALSPIFTAQQSTAQSETRDEEMLQMCSDVNNPLVWVAAARCGIPLDQLRPIQQVEYQKHYQMTEIADILFNLHQKLQRQYYVQISAEIQKIQANGISRGEFVLFNQDKQLAQYVQTKHGIFSAAHVASFHRTLLNEASLVRQMLLKQLKTLASIEQQEQKLKQAIQLSDKEIAAKQTQELKETQKTEQNLRRIRAFKEQSKENVENLRSSIREHELGATMRAENALNEKIATYRQKSVDLAGKQKDFLRQRDLWYKQRELEVLLSFKDDVAQGFNGEYVKEKHSPVRQKNLEKSLRNQQRRIEEAEGHEKRLQETLKDAAAYAKQVGTVRERQRATRLSFQLKCQARQAHAASYAKERETERQNLLTRRLAARDAPKQPAYSEHRRAIMQAEEERQKRHAIVMKEQKIKQEQLRIEIAKEAEKEVQKEMEKRTQDRERLNVALRKIDYLKEQVRLEKVGSLKHAKAYQALQALITECAKMV